MKQILDHVVRTVDVVTNRVRKRFGWRGFAPLPFSARVRASAGAVHGDVIETIDYYDGPLSYIAYHSANHQHPGAPLVYAHWVDSKNTLLHETTHRWVLAAITDAEAVKLHLGLMSSWEVLTGRNVRVVEDGVAGRGYVDRIQRAHTEWAMPGCDLPADYLPAKNDAATALVIGSKALAVGGGYPLYGEGHIQATNMCGIAGFMSGQEVAKVLAASPSWLPIGVGVLASKKTLQEGGNRHRRRYPTSAAIADIFNDDSRCENLVHYATDTTDTRELTAELTTAYDVGGRNCHGLQVNVVWPDPKAIRDFKRARPNARVILQVKLDRKGDVEPEWIATKLTDYMGAREVSPDGVLLDASSGTGKAIDFELLPKIIDDIRTTCPTLIVRVAGGLSPDTLAWWDGYASSMRPKMIALMCHYPWLGFDAESGLRDTAIGGGNLVIDKAIAYANHAAAMWSAVLGL